MDQLHHLDRQEQKVIFLGRMDYEECLVFQKKVHEKVSKGEEPDTIILVEHPPTITSGNQEKLSSLKVSKKALEENSVQFVLTDRGGDMTAHEPGQLVIYPIINLGRLRYSSLGPKKYVNILENAVTEWLAIQGVNSSLDPHNAGVWVLNDKIAAIGIRIKNRTTYHGMALNIYNDLKTFSMIIPCGLIDRGVTSLFSLTSKKIDLEVAGRDISERIYRHIFSGFLER